MIKNVLFIGNSHTYLHYMPQMLRELVRADDTGFELNIDQITGEGVGLEWHWKNAPSLEKKPGGGLGTTSFSRIAAAVLWRILDLFADPCTPFG